MKSWASNTLLGVGRRQQVLRAVLAVALVSGLLWALPVRRPGKDGGHHAAHGPDLDPFERAGVSELREGHRTFFFSSRRRHTSSLCDWSSDVCSSDLYASVPIAAALLIAATATGSFSR